MTVKLTDAERAALKSLIIKHKGAIAPIIAALGISRSTYYLRVKGDEEIARTLALFGNDRDRANQTRAQQEGSVWAPKKALTKKELARVKTILVAHNGHVASVIAALNISKHRYYQLLEENPSLAKALDDLGPAHARAAGNRASLKKEPPSKK